MDNTYNGWRNHSTWVIGLHLMDTVVEIIMDDKDNWDIEEADQAGQLFQDLLEEQIAMSELDKFPLLMDLFNATDVDWYALGQHAIEAALVWSLQIGERLTPPLSVAISYHIQITITISLCLPSILKLLTLLGFIILT